MPTFRVTEIHHWEARHDTSAQTIPAARGGRRRPAGAGTHRFRAGLSDPPVHLIATFPPGSAPDTIARLAGQRLSERLGQQFVIENRPGFGSNIATEYVARAAPDGYTLLMTVSTNAVNATLYPNLKLRFHPRYHAGRGHRRRPLLLFSSGSFPAETLSELIAYLKAHPGKVNLGSAAWSVPHVFAELFQLMTGFDLVHVPYRGNFMPDLLAGQVQVVVRPDRAGHPAGPRRQAARAGDDHGEAPGRAAGCASH